MIINISSSCINFVFLSMYDAINQFPKAHLLVLYIYVYYVLGVKRAPKGGKTLIYDLIDIHVLVISKLL